MLAESRIRSPPIVGVPCLETWCSGPSSRMCWPSSLRRRNAMNFGPSRIETISATTPAMRTRLTGRPADAQRVDRSMQTDARTQPARPDDAVASGGSSSHRGQSLGHQLEPNRPRSLHEHAVAGLDDLPGGGDRGPGVRDPASDGHSLRAFEIAAGQLSDRHERLHTDTRGLLADLAMVLRRTATELR